MFFCTFFDICFFRVFVIQFKIITPIRETTSWNPPICVMKP
jgi:hypothetical protein